MYVRIRPWLVLLLVCGVAGAAQAAGNVPLRDVMKAAGATTHLNTQITMQLYRSHLRKDEVSCQGDRLSAEWKKLSGTQVGPYECRIGERKLTISTKPVYFDEHGHMLAAGDKDLRLKAVRQLETGLKWNWLDLEVGKPLPTFTGASALGTPAR